MSDKPQKPDKIHGIAHLFAAARYSMAGGQRLWGKLRFAISFWQAYVLLRF